ncbi:inositol phospholipid synthesis and fat-storage-inducing TM-domain-containing protein [Hysterangium stoloniferum]|nr:inositol phospholipid synthesis and fat-storage-inducing TM-domain-containing protein [Hysterangium stoloniferum]
MSQRTIILALLSVAVLGGTLYSVINHTYVDTSDPLLAHLPHPLHNQSLFARKTNIFNTLFIKKAWGWTSGAFALLWLTSSPTTRHLQSWLKWSAATMVWATFVAWFFGPAIFERLTVASGGECVVSLPPGSPGQSPIILAVPAEYCFTRTIISPQTHPALFTTSLVSTLDGAWKARPRLYKGHDVSGHIFLLTLSVLFLHDQLQPAWRLVALNKPTTLAYKTAIALSTSLLALWIGMCLATSIYWHSPFEKLTGFAMGIAAFAFIQLPFIGQVERVQQPALATRLD